MGFSKSKKLIQRDKISGFFNPVDLTDEAEYGAQDLAKRVADQQAALNEAIEADWDKGYAESGNPALGNAMSREPRPSDYLNANDRSGAVNADRYGVSQ